MLSLLHNKQALSQFFVGNFDFLEDLLCISCHHLGLLRLSFGLLFRQLLHLLLLEGFDFFMIYDLTITISCVNIVAMGFWFLDCGFFNWRLAPSRRNNASDIVGVKLDWRR